jgi:cell filamentation protein
MRNLLNEHRRNAGYELSWSRLEKETIFIASVKSVHNSNELVEVIRSCIVNEAPDHNLIKFYRSLNI